MKPFVSIVWVNYNSSKFLSTALGSLKGVSELDYPRERYELIVVDNNSTDGSIEAVRRYLPKLGIRYRVIELDKNYGFCKAVNIGFNARDPDTKYLAVLNNDAIPTSQSLLEMVEFLESIPRVAAVQGVVTDLDGKTVAEMGFVCTELLSVHPLMNRGSIFRIPRKSIPVTYVSGCYSLYRVEAILRVWSKPIVYPDIGFAYFDDLPLGILLWSAGYACMAIPKHCALHRGSASFKKASKLQVYLIARGIRALSIVLNNRRIHNFEKILEVSILLRRALRRAVKGEELFESYLAGLRDGVKLGRVVTKLARVRVDLSRVPLVKVDVRSLIYAIVSRKKLDRYVQRKYLAALGVKL
ncbi:MAG: glycosyltransferase family 2 protein [Crenarchaeota archaeon]|nr:glycosyltransferase family 2 protein [Thermoproteota archaeon]